MTELVSVACSAGKLQVLQEGILRILAPFNKVVWQVYCRDVTRFTTTPGAMGSVNITIVTTQGTYTADMVTKANVAKVEALFPHLTTNIISGKEWYHDARALTHVSEYTDLKRMQKEVEAAASYGWVPQAQATQHGKFSAGKALVGDMVLGPVGLLAGAIGNKGKITVTFIRTSQWLALNKADACTTTYCITARG
jgi:hypothetical protein